MNNIKFFINYSFSLFVNIFKSLIWTQVQVQFNLFKQEYIFNFIFFIIQFTFGPAVRCFRFKIDEFKHWWKLKTKVVPWSNKDLKNKNRNCKHSTKVTLQNPYPIGNSLLCLDCLRNYNFVFINLSTPLLIVCFFNIFIILNVVIVFKLERTPLKPAIIGLKNN